MIWIILAFGAHFISCWIRIQEANLMRIHADPDPKHWSQTWSVSWRHCWRPWRPRLRRLSPRPCLDTIIWLTRAGSYLPNLGVSFNALGKFICDSLCIKRGSVRYFYVSLDLKMRYYVHKPTHTFGRRMFNKKYVIITDIFYVHCFPLKCRNVTK